MREIDERIVEMRFKNSNFEKNAKHTIGILDDLEKKISFPNAKKNIEGLEKKFSKISFSALEKGIETVTLKFSALQIAGITAIQNITNKAIDAGEALVKSLSIDQITAGFTKYEQKTTSVQTIMAATHKSIDEVSESLKKLNWFTDETSYNFTDMVDNIGKFTSAGVDLEDAMSAMIGIANEAAISGQNASAASRAMYNFAQAIGTGAVKLIDWKSIENANMATQEFKQTIIDTAVELGTLTQASDGTLATLAGNAVSVNDFNSALKDEWFSSDVLIKSLKKYSDYAEEVYEVVQNEGVSCAEAMNMMADATESLGERAFKAGQEAKTFTDAIEATKDAVSTGWMNTFEMIFGNYEQAKEVWTELTEYLYDFFAASGEARNELLEQAVATDPYKKLISTLKDAGVAEDVFGEAVKKTAKKYGVSIDEIIEREGSLEAAIKKYGWGSFIKEALNDMASGAKVTSGEVSNLTAKFEEYQKVVNDVILGNYGNGAVRMEKLKAAGYDYSEIQALVNKQLYEGAFAIEDLSDEELKNIGYTEEQIAALRELAKQASETGTPINQLIENISKPSGRELIIDSFRNALDGVQKILTTVKTAWEEIFPPKTAEEIYAIIEKFHDLSANLILDDESADKLRRSLKGVFAALDIVKQIIFGITRGGLKILGTLFGKTGLDVAELSASLGDNIVAFREWLNEGNKIGVFFEALTHSILNAKTTVTEWVNSFLENHPKISKWFGGFLDSFEKFKESTKGKWNAIVDDIKNGNIKDALTTVATYFLEFRDTVMSYITGIDFSALTKETNAAGFGKAKNILNDLKGTFLGIVESIKNAAIVVGGWVKTFVESLNPLWFIPVMFGTIVLSIRRISTEIDVLIRALKPLEQVKKAFINMLTTIGKSVSRYMDAKKWTERAKAIFIFASSVAILAGSIWVLAQVPAERLTTLVATLLSFTLALVLVNNLLKGQGKGIYRLQSFAASLGVALILAAAAFKILESIDVDKLRSIIVSFGIIMIGLVGAIWTLSQIEDLPKVKGTLITLGVVIGMISASFVALNFVKTEGLGWKIAGIVVILGALVGVMALLSLMQKKWDGIAKATSLIGIVVALDLLVVSLKLIETVKVKEILKHLGSFISVFVMLRVLAGIASKVNGGSGGWQILALATGLLILVPAINSFAEIDGKALGKAIVAVGSLLLLERLIVGASEFAGQNAAKAGAMILMISVAVSALSLIVWGFTYLDQGKLWSGVAAMDALLLMMAVLVMVSEKAEGSIKKIVVLTVLATILSGVIVALTYMDVDKGLKAAGAIGILLLSLTGSLKLLEKSDGLSLKVIGNLFALSSVVVVLASILTTFAAINPEGAVLQAIAVSTLLMALAGATTIFAKFGNVQNDMKNAWVSLGIMTLAMGAVAVILYTIQDLDPEKMVAQVGALSLAMASLLAVTTLIVLISKIPGIENVNSGLIAVGKVVGIMAGILLVIGGLEATIKELGGSWTLTDLLNEATLVMTALGNAIGSLIGGIFGGIAGGIGEAFTSHLDLIGGNLEVFATHLSTFSSNLEPFITQMTSMKGANELASMTGIIDAISKLTESAFTSSVSDFISWFTGDENAFDKLGNGLISFASALTVVGNIAYLMSGTGTLSSLKEFSEITATLTELLKEVPTQNDFSEWFNGKITFATLGTGLLSYGIALKNFGDSVKDLDTESIDNSVTPTKTLTELLRNIPTDGGMWGAFFDGTLSWDNLSTGLKDLGQALVDYGLKCYAGRNLFTHIINSKDAITALSGMQESIPKIGGVLGWFTGDHNWSALSTGLNDLGDGLISFGNKAKELKDSENLSVVQATVPLLDKFVSTVNEFTNITGLGLINDVAINAATILGSMVNAFGENVGATDIQNRVKKGLAAANDMYDFAKTVSSSYLMGTEMTTLGKDINGYAKEMAAAAKTLRSIDNEDFYELAKYVISGYSNGLYAGQAVVKESVAKAMVDTTLNTLENGLEIHSPSWKTFADGLFTAKGFGGGLEKGKEYIKDAVSGWGQEVLSGIDLNSILDRFSEFGVDLTKVIPDISSLGIDLGTDLTFDYEKRIADMKTNISELTKELGNNSDEVINAQLELDKLQDEYQDYTKSRTSNLEYYENKEYEEAQKQFDKLLEDYKAGRKTQMEFDTEYTQLLQKNTVKQAELFQYSARQIQQYVSDSLEKVQDEFETTISNIQSKMDSTIDSWDKSFDDQFKFTTRQDLFDEEISKWDKDIEQLDKQIETEKKLHGENSLVVQKLEKDRERVKKTRDEINDQWEEQDDEYKNEIVSVDMTGEWEKQTERAKKSLEAVDSLKGRLSDEMIDWLGTLDPETLYAVATDWAGKTDEELQVIMNKYLDMKNANVNLAKALYGPEIQAAEEKFIYDFGNTLNKLPDTAKAIGASVVANMSNSFSEETEKTLSMFKESGDVILFAIKEGLGLVENGKKSKTAEVGEDMSNNIGSGFANNKDELVEVFSDTLGNSLYEATNNVDYDGIAKSLGHGLYEALDNIDADSSVSITPVVSGTSGYTPTARRNLNSGHTVSIATETGSSFNRRYDTDSDDKTNTADIVREAATFVQNIYSPKALNRSEIRRDTKQIFQLANSKFK